jgi:6-phosphogluconolactonase
MTAQRLVFVGTYTEVIKFGTGQLLEGKGEGIYAFKFDPTSGQLTLASIVHGVRNPSYLTFTPSRRFLYCVNEFKEFRGIASGAVSAFALDPESGRLTFLNMQPSHGTDPCHLAVDKTGRFLLVANFASGSVSVFPINKDGSLADASDVKQHDGFSIDSVRQTGPHAHAVTLDNQGRYVYVPDLGLDRVLIYRLDTEAGKLTPTEEPFINTTPGAGPRQVVMHPKRNSVYLINELNSTMTAYNYDEKTGALQELQTLSTLPKDFKGASTCAEVQISPSGKFLYGSNRGDDSIVIFAVSQTDGTLTYVGHESTQGKIPRSFEIDPQGNFLLAANQDTDNIVIFGIDQTTGELASTGYNIKVPTPVCVKFL